MAMDGRLVNRIKMIGAGIALVFVVVLFFQNTENVQLRFFLWNLEMPKLALAALCLLLGFAAGFALAKRPWSR